MKLNDLNLFLYITEKGSMAAAGRALGLSPATVSERLVILEAYYGVTLINRTTRALSLTEEGRTLRNGAQRILSEANDLQNKIKLGTQTLSGTIKVSATIDLGHRMIKPLVDEFIMEHPHVSIELLLTDRYVNIVDEGVDIAIRFGNLEDSTLRSKKLGINRRIVCASPEYISKNGQPETPAELKSHNCMMIRFGSYLDNTWSFREDNQDIQIVVKGNRIANDGRLIHEWCLAGHGIALKSVWDVGPHIRSGQLKPLLEAYAAPDSKVQMVFQPSRVQAYRVKAFADKVNAFFKDQKTENML